jgi:hypothetical protein
VINKILIIKLFDELPRIYLKLLILISIQVEKLRVIYIKNIYNYNLPEIYKIINDLTPSDIS